MDIKTVMRAASQRTGLEKTAYSYQTFRAAGISANPNLNTPKQPVMPAVAQPPPKETTYAAKPTDLNAVKAYGSKTEANSMAATTLAGNMHANDIANAAYEGQQNVDKGPAASLWRGRVYRDASGNQQAVNTADSVGSTQAARQFSGGRPVKFKLWNPKTWDKRADPGVNAGNNAGITVTSRQLRHAQEPQTKEELEAQAVERARVYDLQRGINNGTAINLRQQHRDWRFWRPWIGKPVNEVDARYIYQPKAWGTHIADMNNLTQWHKRNPNTHADEPDKNMPTSADPWLTDEEGNTYRDITAEDMKYDRRMRAKDLASALYGQRSYNKAEEDMYDDILDNMSAMRNNPLYYRNGTWTNDALDYWRNDDKFNTAFNNVHTSSRFDRDAVLNAFLANANNMYRDNSKFVPQQPAM